MLGSGFRTILGTIIRTTGKEKLGSLLGSPFSWKRPCRSHSRLLQVVDRDWVSQLGVRGRIEGSQHQCRGCGSSLGLWAGANKLYPI